MLKRVENTVFFEEVAHSLSEGRPVELRVQGNSMRPCLRGGKDRVVLYPTKDAELKKGCIVLFRYRGNYLLHRIVKRNKDSLTLQGDGVFAQQEQAVVADVVGVVRYLLCQNGKQISAQSFSAACYRRLWRFMRPLRRYLLRAVSKI